MFLLIVFQVIMQSFIAHFAERDDTLQFLEKNTLRFPQVPLFHVILPTVHRSKRVPLKHSFS